AARTRAPGGNARAAACADPTDRGVPNPLPRSKGCAQPGETFASSRRSSAGIAYSSFRSDGIGTSTPLTLPSRENPLGRAVPRGPGGFGRSGGGAEGDMIAQAFEPTHEIAFDLLFGAAVEVIGAELGVSDLARQDLKGGDQQLMGDRVGGVAGAAAG